MKKTIKKIILSAVSVLGISFLFWTVFLLNPSLSYAHQTQFDQVTVYHNQELGPETASIIQDAIDITRTSDIYSPELNIQFCLNDDKLYPKLHPFPGGTAYAFLNKTVMYASSPNFKTNVAEFSWEINNYETRLYHLTTLLAHEFMHNAQHHHNPKYVIMSTLGTINWKLEGHAEYISREFKDDGRLHEKIETYLLEEQNPHIGVPVFKLEDGTIQNLSYYKYALVFQYLFEIKQLNYDQICGLDSSLDKLYGEMIDWHNISVGY